MKYLNAVMVLLFVVAAALQYDNVDPLIWIAIYGLSAVLCVLFAIGKFPTVAASVFAAACLVGSLVMFWDLLTADPIFGGEVFRKAAGLFIVFLWISTLAWSTLQDRSAVT